MVSAVIPSYMHSQNMHRFKNHTAILGPKARDRRREWHEEPSISIHSTVARRAQHYYTLEWKRSAQRASITIIHCGREANRDPTMLPKHIILCRPILHALTDTHRLKINMWHEGPRSLVDVSTFLDSGANSGTCPGTTQGKCQHTIVYHSRGERAKNTEFDVSSWLEGPSIIILSRHASRT